MSYQIRSDSAKTFIERRVKLPRFQRRSVWDGSKNFELLISIYKNYPIGCVIISQENEDGDSTSQWLLDGRQRRNALKDFLEDPDKIYNWAKKFLKIGKTIQPDDIDGKFWKKIEEHLDYIVIEAEEDVKKIMIVMKLIIQKII